MSYNGSGTFLINSAGQPVVPGTTITTTAFNALTADLASGLTTAMTKDGQTVPTANIPMGGFKLTGLGAGTSATDAAQFGQLQNAPVATLITVSGADTITGTLVQTLTAYATGQQFSFVAAGTNTTAVTLNIDGLGAKAVTRTGAVALAAGALVSGQMAIVEYDGTRFQLINANAFTNLTVSGALTVGTTLAVTGVATLTAQPILSSLTASLPVFSDASKGLVSNAMTGTGSVMMSASPTTTGTLTAAAINASGLVAMAGAATVGTTLVVSGGSTFNTSFGGKTLTSAVSAAYMIPWIGDTVAGGSGNLFTTTGLTFNPSTGAVTIPGTLGVTGNTTIGAGSGSPQLKLSGAASSTANSGAQLAFAAAGTPYAYISNGAWIKGGGSTDNNLSIWTDAGLGINLFVNNNATTAALGISSAGAVTIPGTATIQTLTVGLGGGAVSSNTAVGVSALAATNTGGNNAAFAINALLSNTSGANNTAIGTQAFQSNTLGSDNVAVGYQAGYSNTAGSANTIVGGVALDAGTTASYNSAFGNGAMGNTTTGSENSSFGFWSLLNNTTGNYNAVFGNEALRFSTTASNNVAVGYQAGYSTTTGASNIFVGASTVASAVNVNNEIVIGQGATGKGASTGFISPNAGGVYQGNNSTLWSVTSDQRLKKNIVDNNVGLEKITAIQVRNFEYRLPEEVDAELKPSDAIKKEGIQLGVIAQELQQVLPECVKTESTGVMSVDADNLTWYLVNAIKELNADFQAYKNSHP